MQEGDLELAHLGHFIDPPLTTMPLKEWQQFLASMQSKPQGNEVFRDLTEWAQAVVDWKIGGAPDELRKEVGPPPQALKFGQPVQPTARPDFASVQLVSKFLYFISVSALSHSALARIVFLPATCTSAAMLSGASWRYHSRSGRC